MISMKNNNINKKKATKPTDKIPYSIGKLTIKQGRKMIKSLLPFVKNSL